MEIFLTTARTLYEASRTVIWRCRVQRYFYLAELKDLNGRAYRRREPLTAGSLRVDELLLHVTELLWPLLGVLVGSDSASTPRRIQVHPPHIQLLQSRTRSGFSSASRILVPNLFWLMCAQTSLRVHSGEIIS